MTFETHTCATEAIYWFMWWCGNWTLPWLKSRMATPGCDPERYILFQSEKQHYLKSLQGEFSKHRTKKGCSYRNSLRECLEWIFWVFATPRASFYPLPFWSCTDSSTSRQDTIASKQQRLCHPLRQSAWSVCGCGVCHVRSRVHPTSLFQVQRIVA